MRKGRTPGGERFRGMIAEWRLGVIAGRQTYDSESRRCVGTGEEPEKRREITQAREQGVRGKTKIKTRAKKEGTCWDCSSSSKTLRDGQMGEKIPQGLRGGTRKSEWELSPQESDPEEFSTIEGITLGN